MKGLKRIVGIIGIGVVLSLVLCGTAQAMTTSEFDDGMEQGIEYYELGLYYEAYQAFMDFNSQYCLELNQGQKDYLCDWINGTQQKIKEYEDSLLADGIIYNNNGIKVQIIESKVEHVEYLYDIIPSYDQYIVKTYIENNSPYDICVATNDVAVNDFIFSKSLICDNVPSGKKDIDKEIAFKPEDLKEKGISSIDKVDFKLHIYNNKTYDDIDRTETITLYNLFK